ncbi:cytochrome c and c1 heme-lyase [Daldinia vernicosa]|uniref:cytochrome c and c1 heme-lyase n=1 Tax=Daldinia vernicosa TaxID=114800 RepID=UPI002007C352|nr:cytochrome c and c1 heme-lyase [Daldinia vernicosa]KAI0853927.1 cytochrome c and c1 heme-lyase [Daldinia vernicosa]
MSDQSQSECPVDHKSREAWLQQARAAGATEGGPSIPSQSLPPDHPSIPSTASTENIESCPVDHKAREAWLQQAARAAPPPHPPSQHQQPPATSTPTSSSWTSYLPRIPFFSSPSSSPTHPQQAILPPNHPSLDTSREISTIPRSSKPLLDHTETARPANTEQETGADAASGNWVYPSERMFFEAMKRKGHDPRAADMRAVVPIHNAVNERAWAEIKAWEEPYVRGSTCGGPRLHSFSGLSTQMSPRARINTLLGYQAPFDRHDWVVDRCGKEIEYIIDFYAGRNSKTSDGRLSFYLDVRPKLNSWEGVKMRAMRAAGLA